MKTLRTLLALLLTLSLLLSCFAAEIAAATGTVEFPGTATEEPAPTALNVGAFSEEFKTTNVHKYADTDIVRVIVLLEGAPEADYKGTAAQKSAYRLHLDKERTAVKKAMPTNFETAYEFTTLLNGFSGDVAYGELENIAKIDGVSAVHIANHYAEPRVEMPENNYANQVIGNIAMNNSGYNGKGIVVAVLDTGLRTTHEAFQVYNSMPITSTLTSSSISKASVKAKYVSAKVPFAYDYADKDNDVSDKNGHGTHVSGTAVGYSVTSDGALKMSGGAPAAQLVSMKIFKDSGGGTSSDIYFSALEDCYTLGVDVVNMSIGAQNGFTYDSSLETNVFGNIYKRMEQAGIVMCVAAGNEYSMAEFSSIGYIGTDYTDFGTIASPAAYEGNISVAAVQNSNYPTYMLTFNGMRFTFVDACQDGSHGWLQTFTGKSTGVVVLKNSAGTDLAMGTASDFASVNVKGKIAVVSRGDISFQEKMDNAANAGAVGVIVCNSESGTIAMTIDPYAIPAISVSMSLRETFLSAASSAKLSTPTDMTFVENSKAYQMCDFSNWGTSPMLTIDPTISSIGGMVYSAVPDSDTAYDVMSGTSMACPNAAGTFACLLQAVRAAGKASDTSGSRTTLTKVQSKDRAIALMESTGIILQDADDYIYSVRRQGAGLANSSNSANAYFYGAYISNPIQELGDDKNKTGIYTMDLTLVNDGYETVTYDDFNAYILYDQVGQSDTGYVNMLQSGLLYSGKEGSATVTYKLDGQTVTSVTLKPSETKTLTVTITLGSDIKSYYDTYFPNGSYVEGYVSFSNTNAGDDSPEVHGTFLAYYGDWQKAPAMETLNTFHYLQAAYALNNEIYENGKTYAEAGFSLGNVIIEKFGSFYTDLNSIYTVDSDGEVNNYLGANFLDVGNTPYSSAYHAISTPNTNGAASDAVGLLIYPNLLRNARAVKMTIKDKNTGTVYLSEQANYVPKDRYDVENGIWTPSLGFEWYGTKSDGKSYVASGTVATVSLDVMLPYGESSGQWQKNAMTFDVTVDYTAPVIKSAVYDASKQLIAVTASDAQYLASILLCSSDGKTLYTKETFSPSAAGESCTAIFDVSGISNKNLIAIAFDYATNQISKTVTSGTVNTDPTDPTDPTEPTDPTDPTEPTEPAPTVPAEPTTETYKLVTSAASLTDGEYLVVTTATGAYAGDYDYYIMTALKDGTYAAMMSSGQNFGSFPGSLTLDTSIKSSLVWTFKGNANGFTISTADGTYLTGNSTSTALSLTASGSTWKGSYDSSKYGFLLTTSGRYLALRDDITTVGSNGSPLFVTHNSTKATVYMHLYKKEVATCTHSNTETVTTPATCTTDGEAVLLCKDCGATLSTTVIPATGHSPVTTTTAPTCTANGKAVETCATCKITLSTTTLPATGHNYASVVTPPTCISEGYTTYTCIGCDDSYVDDYVKRTNHSYEKVVTASTCSAEGYTTYTCTGCGDSYKDDYTAPSKHSYTAVVTAPTCSAEGYTTYTCTTCGNSYVDDYTPTADHNYTAVTTAPTCTAEGYTTYTCTGCGYTLVDDYTPTADHTYVGTVTAPTCTAEGYTTYTCSACSNSYVDDYTPKANHIEVYTSNGDGTHRITCESCTHMEAAECYMVNGQCTYCGYVAEEEDDVTPELLSIQIGHSLNLASDISINYAVAASALTGYSDFYLECKVPIYTGNTLTGTTTVIIEPVANGSYYYFTMDGLIATQMNNVIESTLFATKDGKLYASQVDSYSIAMYAYKQLNKATTKASLKTLCAELLRYGAKAQILKSYRTDALTDGNMTAAHISLLSDLDSVEFGNNNTVFDNLANPTITWPGKSLILDSKVTIRMIVDLTNYKGKLEDLSARVTYVNLEGQTVTETLTDIVLYNEARNFYSFDFSGLRAAELRTVVNATVYEKDVQVSATMAYSPDTYGNGKTGNVGTLCKALMAYSDAALAYFLQ